MYTLGRLGSASSVMEELDLDHGSYDVDSRSRSASPITGMNICVSC